MSWEKITRTCSVFPHNNFLQCIYVTKAQPPVLTSLMENSSQIFAENHWRRLSSHCHHVHIINFTNIKIKYFVELLALTVKEF